MALTAGELRKVLDELPDDADVLLSHEGTMHYAAEVRANMACPAIVLQSTGRPKRIRHFSSA